MEHATAILYFGKPKLTLRCLHSVIDSLEKARLKNHKILLIDNGSPEIQIKIPETNHVIQTLRLNENCGFSKGFNSGLEKLFSNSEISLVTMLSNDVEVASDFYSNIPTESYMPTIFCPNVYHLMDVNKLAYTHGIVSKNLELSHHSHRVKDIRFPKYFPAAAMTWGRVAYEKLNGFNEEFFCYWEDVELSYRCMKEGIKLLSYPKLKVFHLGRGTTKGKTRYYDEFKKGQSLCRKIISSHAFE